MRIIEYDRERYCFHKIIGDFLDVNDLTAIEADVNKGDGNSIYKNMERTSHYKKLYKKLNDDEGQRFYTLYEQFIESMVRPMYQEPIYYQKKPTHRIHFKNSSGSSRFHRDSDYGHNRAEVNYSVPQTPMYATNSIWIESEEGKEDYKPMEVEVGQFVEFNGAYLKHGAKQNCTGITRVSFDFRVMPESEAPDVFTDKSSWKEEDKDNPLFKNAHNFALCK